MIPGAVTIHRSLQYAAARGQKVYWLVASGKPSHIRSFKFYAYNSK